MAKFRVYIEEKVCKWVDVEASTEQFACVLAKVASDKHVIKTIEHLSIRAERLSDDSHPDYWAV